MMDGAATFFVECFWPGVTENDLAALDRRAEDAAAALNEEGRPIRYLGSILMRADEVVLCQFEGPEAAVHAAAARAAIPFERILETTRSDHRHRPAEHEEYS